MNMEIIVEDPGWDDAGLERLAGRAAGAVFDRLGIDPERVEFCILACDDARIAALNADFRGKPVATNVLSWPARDLAALQPGGKPARPGQGPQSPMAGPLELGDIAIARETCLAEAREQGKRPEDHITHLIVHALLHLLGYDHIRDPDATLMETLEVQILGKLGVGDPYSGHQGA